MGRLASRGQVRTQFAAHLGFDTLALENIVQRMFKCISPDTCAQPCCTTSATERLNLARLLRVLGDPTRLSIFDLLMEGVQCNCEIADRLDLSLSLISHHLRVLQQAGLVHSERDLEDARWVYYSINHQALESLGRALAQLLDAHRIQPRMPNCGPKGCSPKSS